MIVDLECVSCGRSQCLDLRYFYTININSYELEYHCSTLHGGCNFYRIISLMHAHEDPHQQKLGEEE